MRNALSEFALTGHVNFVACDGINETIFKVGKSLVGENLNAPTILKLPFALEGYDALFDISIHEGMYIQAELLDGQLTRQHIYLIFQEVCKQEAALDMSGAAAGGAGFLHLYFAGGTHTLAGDLHQTEFLERQNIVASAVLLHVFDHTLIKLLAILGQIHVDKVHHNNSAHIAKAQLTR